MSIALRAGSRPPLYCTSMGRVLMAGRSRADQERYLARTKLIVLTAETVVEPSQLLGIFSRTADQGYAIVDQELEQGLRSVAVPVVSRGEVVAAVNIGTQAARVPMAELRSRYVPALKRVARDLGTVAFGP